VLFGEVENPDVTMHPLIRSVAAPAVDGDRVRHFPATISSERAEAALVDLCDEMSAELEGGGLETFPYDWSAVAGGS
jgi:hypothetical protein